MTTPLKSLPPLPCGFFGRELTTIHGGGMASDFPNPSGGPLYPSETGQVNLSDQLRDALKEMGQNISPMYRHTVSTPLATGLPPVDLQSIVFSPKMSCRLYVVAAMYGPSRCWEQEQVMRILEKYWLRPQELGSEFGSIPIMPDETLRRNLAELCRWPGLMSEPSKVSAIPSFTQIVK